MKKCFLIVLVSLVFITETLNTTYQLFEDFNKSKFLYVLTIIIIAWTLIKVLDNYYNSKSFLKGLKSGDDPVVIEQTYEITIRIFKIIVILISLLTLMQEFGLSISGLLAFGGVGGLVVGLAAKDLLSNFFGGLMIYFDRPFKVGEFSPELKNWPYHRDTWLGNNCPPMFFTLLLFFNPVIRSILTVVDQIRTVLFGQKISSSLT